MLSASRMAVTGQGDSKINGIKGARGLARRLSQTPQDFFVPLSQREKPVRLEPEVEAVTSNVTTGEDGTKKKRGRLRKKSLDTDGKEDFVPVSKADQPKMKSLEDDLGSVDLLRGEEGAVNSTAVTGEEENLTETQKEQSQAQLSEDPDFDFFVPLSKKVRPKKELFKGEDRGQDSTASDVVTNASKNLGEGPETTLNAQGSSEKVSPSEAVVAKGRKRGRPKKFLPEDELSLGSEKPLEMGNDITPKKRGRPKKKLEGVEGATEIVAKTSDQLHQISEVLAEDELNMGSAIPLEKMNKITPKKRGRPRKKSEGVEGDAEIVAKTSEQVQQTGELLPEDELSLKSAIPLDKVNSITPKKRGRPRKQSEAVEGNTDIAPKTSDQLQQTIELLPEDELSLESAIPLEKLNEVSPKKRGRPRKQPEAVEGGTEIVAKTSDQSQQTGEICERINALGGEKHCEQGTNLNTTEKRATGCTDEEAGDNREKQVASNSGLEDTQLSQTSTCDDFFMPVSKRRKQKGEVTDGKQQGKGKSQKDGKKHKSQAGQVQLVTRLRVIATKEHKSSEAPIAVLDKEVEQVDDLRLEALLAAQENARLNAGKTTHPFFAKKKASSVRTTILLDEISTQVEDYQPCPPIHVTQWNEEERAEWPSLGWSFSPAVGTEGTKLADLVQQKILSLELAEKKNKKRTYKLMEKERSNACREDGQAFNLSISTADLSTSRTEKIVELYPGHRRRTCLNDLLTYMQAFKCKLKDRHCPEIVHKFDTNLSLVELEDRLSWYTARHESLTSAENVSLSQLTKYSSGEALTRNLLWTDMYQPRMSEEVCGNTTAVEFLSSWFHNWQQKITGQLKSGEDLSKAYDSDDGWFEDDSDSDCNVDDDAGLQNTLLATGPEGCGKSAAIYACAGEHGFTVIEVNTSDWRNGSLIKHKFGEAMASHGLQNVPQAAGESPLQVSKKGIKGQTLESPQQVCKRGINGQNLGSPQQVTKNVIKGLNLESPLQSSKKGTKGQSMESPLQSSKKGTKGQSMESPQQVNKKGVKGQSRESPLQVTKKGTKLQILKSPQQMSKTKRTGQNVDSPPQMSKKAIRGHNLSNGSSQQNTVMQQKAPECHEGQPLGTQDEPQIDHQSKSKTVILFEDVDKQFEEDKGFASALVHLSKISKRPIILTSNKSEPGLNQVLEKSRINLSHPTLEELVLHACLVCIAEGLSCNPWLVERLVDSCQCDIRKVLMTLQFWSQGKDVTDGIPLTRDSLRRCTSKMKAARRQEKGPLGPRDWHTRWLFELDVHHFVVPKLFSSSEGLCRMSLHVSEKVCAASIEQEEHLADVAARQAEDRDCARLAKLEIAELEKKAFKKEQQALRQAFQIHQLLEDDDDDIICTPEEVVGVEYDFDETLNNSPVKSLRKMKSLARSPLKPKVLKSKRINLLCDSADENKQTLAVQPDGHIASGQSSLLNDEVNISDVVITRPEDIHFEEGSNHLEDVNTDNIAICEAAAPVKWKRLSKKGAVKKDQVAKSGSNTGDLIASLDGSSPSLRLEVESVDTQADESGRSESSDFHLSKIEAAPSQFTKESDCLLVHVNETLTKEMMRSSNLGDGQNKLDFDIAKEQELQNCDFIAHKQVESILCPGHEEPVDITSASTKIIEVPDSKEIGDHRNGSKVSIIMPRLSVNHVLLDNIGESATTTDHFSLGAANSREMKTADPPEVDLIDPVKDVWTALKHSRHTYKTMINGASKSGDVTSLAYLLDVISASDVISGFLTEEFQDAKSSCNGTRGSEGNTEHCREWDDCQEVASQLVHTGLQHSLNVLPAVEHPDNGLPFLASIMECAEDTAAVGKCMLRHAGLANNSHALNWIHDKADSTCTGTNPKTQELRQARLNEVVQRAVHPKGRVTKSDVVEYRTYLSRMSQLEKVQRSHGLSSGGRRNRRVGYELISKFKSMSDSDVTELLLSSKYSKS